MHPSYAAHLNPLMKWATSIHQVIVDGERKHHVLTEAAKTRNKMKAAFNTQFEEVANAQDPWKHVKGPTSAMIATLLRIRWFLADYDTWLTDDNETIDLKVVIPYMVSQKITRAVERMLWENCTLKKHDSSTDRNQVPNLYIARKVILGKDRLIGAMARSVTIGTQWTQSRINPEDNICRACNLDVGNLHHRQMPGRWMCKESERCMPKHLTLKTIEKIGNGYGGNLFAKHALLMPRYLPPLTPIAKKAVQWQNPNAPKRFRGNVYTDGTTTISHAFPDSRRSGIGAVMVSDELPNSDEEPVRFQDEQYVPEADPVDTPRDTAT